MEEYSYQYTQYSSDRKKLIKVPDYHTEFQIMPGTEEICDKAFEDCANIKSVTIPNSVIRIGNEAFKNCSNLTRITIPDSVIYVGDWAFSGCCHLNAVSLPDSLRHIGTGVFRGCSAINSINIPRYVTHIGDWAFCCKSLSVIFVPNTVTHIGKQAFYDIDNVLSIHVEKGNKVYDSRDNCNAIIHTSTNTLVLGCKNTVNRRLLGNYTSVPDAVTRIGEYAFYGCKGLEQITLPESVTHIKRCAFWFCI